MQNRWPNGRVSVVTDDVARSLVGNPEGADVLVFALGDDTENLRCAALANRARSQSGTGGKVVAVLRMADAAQVKRPEGGTLVVHCLPELLQRDLTAAIRNIHGSLSQAGSSGESP